MLVMAGEAGGPHRFPLDGVLKRQVPSDEPRVPMALSSPKNSPGKGDKESVRVKLRESLTSALELVVSKQLVKSVLGVVKDVDEASEEEKPSPKAQAKTEDVVMAEADAVAGEAVTKSSGGDKRRSGVEERFDSKMEVKVDEIQLCYDSLSAFKQQESQSQVNDSLPKKSKSELEERVMAGEGTKSGLQLMEQARRVAWDVEVNLFSLHGGVSKKYKEKARSLLFNLKDKSNPELRARVFNGEISPEVLVAMTAAQLASKELSQWRTAKAEEFASMVVLTDADVDARRIVKKTHKGEFEVAVEEIDFAASVENVVSVPTFRENPDVGEEGREGGPMSGRVGKVDAKSKRGSGVTRKDGQDDGPVTSQSLLSPQVAANHVVKREEADDCGRDLPAIMSLDEYVDNRTEAAMVKVENIDASVVDKALETLGLTSPGISVGNVLISSTGSLDRSTSKGGKISTVGGSNFAYTNGTSVLSDREKDLLWNGSLQLSATRLVPINGFYKSGERLELKDWPKSVEVKGRVRLGALDKFLQDLQISRSRTVTVLSICPSDSQGDVKQTGLSLKEMADQYRTGERAGFVEPRPGFELYLLAPGSASLELLSEDLRSNKASCEREDEVLVGVVVWRKSQSQGLPVSRGLDQNVSVKKVAFSNAVSDSHSKVKAESLHCTETPGSRGALPASAPSLVSVSGISTMHSTKLLGDFTVKSDTSSRREWQQPSAASCLGTPSSVAPINRIEEIARGVTSGSRPASDNSVEDGPPGFLPQSAQGFPPARSSASHIDSQEHLQGYQAPPSFLGSVSGPVGLQPGRNRGDPKDVRPGVLPELVGKAPGGPIALPRRNSIATQEDDDDLPEFNFETVGIGRQPTGSHLPPPNQAQFVPPPIHNIAPQTFSGFQHTSDPSNRFHQNVPDRHPPPMAFPPVPNGFPRKHGTLDDPFAPRSVPSVPSIERWGHSEMRPGEPGHTLQHHDVSRPVMPLDGIDHRGLQLRAPREEAVAREEFGKFGHDSHIASGLPTPVSFSSKPSTPHFLNGALDTVPNSNLMRSHLSGWCPPALVPRSRWPSHAPGLPNHHVHGTQHPPFVHMMVQHPHASTKNSALNWPVEAPLPQQETRRHEWQAKSMSNSFKWVQPNSTQTNYRSTNQRRRLEQREGSSVEGGSQNNAKDVRSVRDRTRVRERSRELSPSPSRDTVASRRGNTSITPPRDTSQTHSKDVQDNTEQSSELRRTKPPKRERERDQ